MWHLIKPDRREEGMTVLFDRNYEVRWLQLAAAIERMWNSHTSTFHGTNTAVTHGDDPG